MAGESLGKLEVLLGANYEELTKGLAEAQKEVAGFSKGASEKVQAFGKESSGTFASMRGGLNDLAKNFAIVGAAVGAALAGAGIAIWKIVDSTAEMGDGFAKTSKRIGVSAETLSAWSHAAGLSDVSNETLTKGMKNLADRALDAKLGLAEGSRGFQMLGISAVDSTGKLRPMEELLLDVADRFSQMEDGTEKAAIASEIFGRAGLELIPLLNEGRDGIKAMTDEARELGIVFTDEAAAKSEEFKDNLERLQSGVKGLKISIGNELMPVLNEYIVGAVEWAKQNRELIAGKLTEWIQQLVSIMQAAAPIFMGLIDGLGMVFKGLQLIILAARERVAASMEFLSDKLADFLEFAARIPVIGDKFKGVAENVRQFSDTWGEVAGEFRAELELSALKSENLSSRFKVSYRDTAATVRKETRETTAFVIQETEEEKNKRIEAAKKAAAERIKLEEDVFKRFTELMKMEADSWAAKENAKLIATGDWTAFYQQYLDNEIGVTKEAIDSILNDESQSFELRKVSLKEYYEYSKEEREKDKKDNEETIKSIASWVSGTEAVLSSFKMAVEGGGNVEGFIQVASRAAATMGPEGQIAAGVINIGMMAWDMVDSWLGAGDKWEKQWKETIRKMARTTDEFRDSISLIRFEAGLTNQTVGQLSLSTQKLDRNFSYFISTHREAEYSVQEHAQVFENSMEMINKTLDIGADAFRQAQGAIQGMIDRSRQLSETVQKSATEIQRAFYMPSEMIAALQQDISGFRTAFQRAETPEQQLEILEEMRAATVDLFNQQTQAAKNDSEKRQAQLDAMETLNWIDLEAQKIGREQQDQLAVLNDNFESFLEAVEGTNEYLREQIRQGDKWGYEEQEGLRNLLDAVNNLGSKLGVYQEGGFVTGPGIVHPGEFVVPDVERFMNNLAYEQTNLANRLSAAGMGMARTAGQVTNNYSQGGNTFIFPGSVFAKNVFDVVDEMVYRGGLTGQGRAQNLIKSQNNQASRVNVL